jgi:hypothetical protein
MEKPCGHPYTTHSSSTVAVAPALADELPLQPGEAERLFAVATTRSVAEGAPILVAARAQRVRMFGSAAMDYAVGHDAARKNYDRDQSAAKLTALPCRGDR